ncbi:MAG: hypothetical protein GEU90_22220 [Gemmatimonas sp.]|nr:hypothetical protein [Gemmatimonas sp.]
MIHVHWHRKVSGLERRILDLDWYGECRCGHRKWHPLVYGWWPVDRAWLRGEGDRPWGEGRQQAPPPRRQGSVGPSPAGEKGIGMRYRSKPSEIEALQWTGDNLDELTEFEAPAGLVNGQLVLMAGVDGAQGDVPVPVGHWIVRVPGDFSDHWPVDPDYFKNKYEEYATEAEECNDMNCLTHRKPS